MSGRYTSGGTPPSRDTSSRQNRQGSALPPTWKATCPWALSTGEVKVYVYASPAASSTGVASYQVSYGATPRPTTARTPCPSGTPEALKENRYDSPFTRVMASWPTAESQRLTVPPGTSAHNRPSAIPAVTLLVHQGSAVVPNPPFLTCSASSAPACCAGSAVSAAPSRAARDSRVVLRRFTSRLLGKCGTLRAGQRCHLMGALPERGRWTCLLES